MFDCCTCRRTGAAMLFSTALAVGACGGGQSAEPASLHDSAPALLDDEGLPMPTHPSAWPPGVAQDSARRYATAAQAADLRRALGAAVTTVEVACCGDAAVERAVIAALGPAGTLPKALLLEAGDAGLAAAAADRLRGLGLEHVWVVSP